jgi:hypothetical protein
VGSPFEAIAPPLVAQSKEQVMDSKPTYIWGTVADSSGLVHHSAYRSEALAGGGMRAERLDEYLVEPASAYADTHKAPMPMKWFHGEDVGGVIALRRMHGKLLAVAESDELEPDELRLLAEKYGGDLKWSAGTRNLRGEALRIMEVSLTGNPASVGLWAVRWHRAGVSKGNLPG